MWSENVPSESQLIQLFYSLSFVFFLATWERNIMFTEVMLFRNYIGLEKVYSNTRSLIKHKIQRFHFPLHFLSKICISFCIWCPQLYQWWFKHVHHQTTGVSIIVQFKSIPIFKYWGRRGEKVQYDLCEETWSSRSMRRVSKKISKFPCQC